MMGHIRSVSLALSATPRVALAGQELVLALQVTWFYRYGSNGGIMVGESRLIGCILVAVRQIYACLLYASRYH